jgi:hypothetical protein
VIAEHDRDALERLCRYGARPALAQERLARTLFAESPAGFRRTLPGKRALNFLALTSSP